MKKGTRRIVAVSDGKSAAAEPVDTRLTEVLKLYSSGGGWRVKIQRYDGETYNYLGTLALTLDLEDVIQSKWGGGKYRGRIIDVKGQYHDAIPEIGIGGPSIEPTLAANRNAPAAAAAPSSTTDRLLEQLVAGNAALHAHLMQQTRVDPLEMITKTAAALKSLAGDAPAAAKPVDTLDLVDRVFAFRDRIMKEEGGSRGDSGEMVAVVREGLVPLVQTWRQKLDNDRQVIDLRSRRLGAGAAQNPPPGATPAEPLSAVARLARQIPADGATFLSNMAAADKDPSLYADVVLDALSEEAIRAIASLIDQPGFAAELAAAVPAWRSHGEWIAQLVAEIRESLVGDGIPIAAHPAAAAATEQRTA